MTTVPIGQLIMTRASVIQKIEQYFDQGQFFSDLS
ncbi:uncharacterized protein METZ01_LOCUS406520, partial [marine metagenome]